MTRRPAGLAASLALTALAGLACEPSYDNPPPTTTTTAVPPTTITAPVTAVTINPPGGGGGIQATTVGRVVDGDTLELADGRKVRLIGIDTPEIYGGVECGGPEASAALKTLLPPGTPVTLIPDVTNTDRYDRLLRYVHAPVVGDVGEELVTQGYATSTGLKYAPDTTRAAVYDTAQATAQAAAAGMWGPARDEWESCR